MGWGRGADQKWLHIPYRSNIIIVEAMVSVQQAINGKDFILHSWWSLTLTGLLIMQLIKSEHSWALPSYSAMVISLSDISSLLAFSANNNNNLKIIISDPLLHCSVFYHARKENSKHKLAWQARIQSTSRRMEKIFWSRLPASHAGMSHCL